MAYIETPQPIQKAVLWAANGLDENGDPKVDSPVEIDVRWQRVQNVLWQSASSLEAITDRVVVGQDIAIGSVMWKGKLADLPSPLTDLKEVVGTESTDDIKFRNTSRVVNLKKLGTTLPALSS